jgi:hypothetical protein
MSLEDIDLNIDNYNYQELLDLLDLNCDFGEIELKKAKKMVLMTHPDKSNYDKDIFIFMAKVYKLVYQVYITTNKTEDMSLGYNEYDNDVNNIIKTHKNDDFKNQLNKFSKSKNFNREFNKLFEKYKLSNEEEESGYGNWLKEEEHCETANNINDMNKYIETKKKHLSSLIVYKDPDELNNNSVNYSNLINKKPEYYESNLFDNLKYDDVKKVYTESVIPVTYDDYTNKEKFNSVGDLQMHRTSNFNNINYNKIDKYKNNITETERAYELVKQDKRIRENYKNINSIFLRLKN